MKLDDTGFLEIDAQRLEYRMIGPRPDSAPTIVMLHEGLGSVGLWNDFSDHVQKATGLGVFVYSRAGYGQSGPVPLPRPMSYMHDEAREILPRLLDAIGFKRGLLLGHSDGASIAAIYAGSHQDHRVGGVILMAPHFIVEDVTIAAIAEMRQAYDTGDLRPRLARWHADVDATVHGWSDVWLKGNFRDWDISEFLAYVRVPVLIVQGEHDQYGTAHQIAIAEEECYCPVEVALLPGARHSPQRDAPEATLKAVADFTARVMQMNEWGVLA